MPVFVWEPLGAHSTVTLIPTTLRRDRNAKSPSPLPQSEGSHVLQHLPNVGSAGSEETGSRNYSEEPEA